ncbi:MAG: endolytic transglycosylase MltG [Bifidobacteriaceae bacterium]|jgi:UPF0755 protein|nr:endolytic transglycosylase MltG [Bifidobacteriaceae bacterium]
MTKHADKSDVTNKKLRVIIATILAVLLVSGLVAYKFRGEIADYIEVVTDYQGAGTPSVAVNIPEGAYLGQIAKIMADSGVVKNERVFLYYAGNSTDIRSGTYILNKDMSAKIAFEYLMDGKHRDDYMIEFPAGRTVRYVSDTASEVTGIAREDFQKIIDKPSLIGLPKEADGVLEGWLKPGIYTFPKTADLTAETVLKTMLQEQLKVLDGLNVPAAKREDVLNRASIVQLEAGGHIDIMGKIARVIENRLTTNATNHLLGMDVINGYGLKKNPFYLTVADFQDDNPYNSRLVPGLPPTPIGNPAKDAISAVLNPENGDWIYYVTVNLDTGETLFTESAAQFEEYKAQYQEWVAKNGLPDE